MTSLNLSRWIALASCILGIGAILIVLKWCVSLPPLPKYHLDTLSSVDSISWSDDDVLLSVAFGHINVLNAVDGHRVAILSEGNTINERCAAFIKNNRVACNNIETGLLEIRSWNVDRERSRAVKSTPFPSAYGFCLSNGGQSWAIQGISNTEILDVDLRSILTLPKGTNVLFHKRGDILYALLDDQSQLVAYEYGRDDARMKWTRTVGHPASTVGVCGDVILIGHENGSLTLLDAVSGDLFGTLSVSSVRITAIGGIAQRGIAVVGDRHGHLVVISVSRRSIVSRVNGMWGQVSVIAPSHSEEWVAIGYTGCRLEMWSVDELSGPGKPK